MSDVTSQFEQVLGQLQDGAEAADVHARLFPLVYEELRSIAARQAARWKPGDTLRPTALVNEAWLRLAGATPRLAGKAHFLAVVAKAMRSVLVDHVRAKRADKRGGDALPVTLDEQLLEPEGGGADPLDVLDLERALERLARRDPRRAHLVELRFFGGLTVGEIAEVLAVSRSTVEKDWVIARTRLAQELSNPREAD